ncbi:MATE family efflux transporter [Colwellia sp. 4_MG-2023]|uniref:MATE family efflux transporter n=1 Tax=unclassified Colwellia TaxID=196834 RepID=UPI0026E28341|nr:MULTISPECIES: MATE family efflux transporter [unclassified Colwellia]MDO6508782.1 MATE family efflux transporter [Colwellia sp. 5_MG-2023]MDO6557466.1 MATE family efflux transporter [Colwellia sp. 4_MG-2023]
MNSSAYVRRNFALAWPLAFNALLVQSMLMIDTLLVAPLGELPVAAMGIATTIVAFVLGLEIAIGNGIQLLVGRAFGSDNKADLAVAYWSGLLINISTSFVFLFILSLWGTDLVAFITDDSDLAQLANKYISITKYIVVITAYTQVCTAFCNGQGNSKVPLKGFMIELPVNALLSYLLINGFATHQGLGVEGAAWGSLIAVFLRAIFFYLALRTDNKVDLTYPKNRHFWLEIGPQYREIYPIAANFFVLSVGATVYQLLFAQLDLFSFVAITLIFPWVRAGTQFPNAWAQASGISISQLLGQKETSDLKHFVTSCTKVGMTLSVIIAGLFFILSQCIRWVYPDIEPETQTALMIIAPLYIVLPIIRAYNTVAGNILRALGNSNLVLKIHFVTQWAISLPVCAVLVLYFEVSIFWAFAMIPIEELLKTIPFYRYKKTYISRL